MWSTDLSKDQKCPWSTFTMNVHAILRKRSNLEDGGWIGTDPS